ncbi:MAG: HD domain-containing protein [Candidatus Theseobacter exili]|nr:HD domain-containing protein [Candidatus Theseobacter exili]
MSAFLLSLRKSHKKNIIIKAVSSFLSFSMIFCSTGVSFYSEAQAQTVSLKTINIIGNGAVSNMSIHELDIKGMRRGNSFTGSQKAQLVLIRDLHCQLEAQMGIAGAIRQIHNKTGISRVFMEGAEGAVRTLLYESFPNETVRKMVGKEFVKNGYLTGAEYAAIESGVSAGLELYGVEEARLYIENLKAFRETRKKYAEIKKETDGITEWIGKLKDASFSDRLKAVDSVYEMIDGRQKLELEKALKQLAPVITEGETQPVKDPFTKWPEVSKLNRAFEINGEIDQEKVDGEMSGLINLLEKSLVKEDLKEMISRALRYRLGHIPATEYLGYLKELYESNNPTDKTFKEAYPQLEIWHEVSVIQESIEFEILMEELGNLVSGLRDKFAEKEGVREIVQLYDRWRLMEKLINLELRQEDLKELKKQGIQNVKEKFFKEMSTIGKQYPGTVNAPGEPAGLDGVIKSSWLFYDCASKRDNVLVTRTLERFKESKDVNAENITGKGILVTGGFHTQGIEAILKEKGVSFLTLTPMVNQGVDLALYEERMMDNAYDLDGIEFSDKRLAWRARTDGVLRMLAAPVLLGNILGGQGGEELLVRMVNNGMSAEKMEPNEVVNEWLGQMGIEDVGQESAEALRAFVAANMDQVHFLFSVLGVSEVEAAVINLSTLGQSQVEKELVCGLCKAKGWTALDRLAEAYFGLKEAESSKESPDAGVRMGDDSLVGKDQIALSVLERDNLRARQTLSGGTVQAESGFPILRDILRGKLDGKISSDDMGMVEDVFTKILQMNERGKAEIPDSERAGYHDVFHTMEVALDAVNNALEAGIEERALAAVTIAALLHDRSMLEQSTKQYNKHEALSAEGVEGVLGLEPGDEMAVAVNRIILMTQFSGPLFIPAILLQIAEKDVEGWPTEKTASFMKKFQLRRAGAVVALADLKSAFASENYIDMVGGLFREYMQTDGANRETSTFQGNLGWVSAYDVFAGTSFFIDLAFNLRLRPLWQEAVQSTEEDVNPRTGDVKQDIAVNQKIFGIAQGLINQLNRGRGEPLTAEQEKQI